MTELPEEDLEELKKKIRDLVDEEISRQIQEILDKALEQTEGIDDAPTKGT